MQKQVIKLAFLLLNSLAAAALMFADTANRTWADAEWNTTWVQGSTSGACDTTGPVAVYSATGGNPNNRRYAHCKGKNDNTKANHRWEATWETFGVTSGNTVSTAQMTGLDTQATIYTTCGTLTIGPFELRTTGDAVQATLWGGRTPTAVETGWTAAGSQPAQSVGSLTNSTDTIRLVMENTTNTGNNSNGECQGSIDNLTMAVVHSAPASNIINRFLIAWGMKEPDMYETRIDLTSGKSATRRIN